MGKTASRCTRWLYAVLASAVLACPSPLLADLPAKQSRIITVCVRDSVDGVLALRCQSLRGGDGAAVQCTPSDAGKEFRGFAEAVEVNKHHAVAVSAYSSNVSTPHGELFSAVQQALENFRRAIANDPNVLRVEECAAPDYKPCVLPP